MNIAIIGAGNMGKLIGSFWKKAGHNVVFGVKDISMILEDFETKSVSDAVNFGEVVLLAVNYWTVNEALENFGAVEGKILIDLTNPYAPDANNPMGFGRTIPENETAHQHIAQKLPSNLWVKTFCSLAGKMLQEKSNSIPKIALGYATNNEAIKPTVERLIAEIGFEPVFVGDLSHSKDLELMGKYAMKTLTKQEFLTL